MKHIKNNQGLTLIEMLATITILFIIGGMVYAMLFQMFSNFNTSENRITARQEANLIIAHLTMIHQTSDKFEIEYESENFFKTTADDDDSNTMMLGHKNYQYELRVASQTLSETNPITIDLTDEANKELKIDLTLSNEHDEFDVTTTISRMTKAKGDEE